MDSSCTTYIVGAVITVVALVGFWYAYKRITNDPEKEVSDAKKVEEDAQEKYDKANEELNTAKEDVVTKTNAHNDAKATSEDNGSTDAQKEITKNKLNEMNVAIETAATKQKVVDTKLKDLDLAKAKHLIVKDKV